jgi:pimeloyl-ACP methyl ester carboxylesterase
LTRHDFTEDQHRNGLQASRRHALRSAAGIGALALLSDRALAAPPEPGAALALRAATQAVAPFAVHVPQSALDDLRRRLRDARWPEQETVTDDSQGVPLAAAKSLVNYWQTQYDWRKFERRLNALPQFRTQIDGLGVHFIHVRSAHPNALPLILTHGWPGSVVEFLNVIRPLTDPTAFGGSAGDAFDVVVPSLPGFGFSDKPRETGWNVARIAKAWAALMQRLGYVRWAAQGGDWGAGVTTALGHLRPAGLAGIHLNWPLVFPEKVDMESLSPDELRAVKAAGIFLSDGSGYFAEQTTRPQTVGYALADSPAGQAAWIYEKLRAWTDSEGNPDALLGRDAILDNISLYWLTNTAASSARIYAENKGGSFAGGKLDLPVAATVFPHEIYRAPKSWAQQTYSNLIYWNEAERGGHFAAFEQPEIFVRELRDGLRPLRSL